jgi:hypothetical protein
VQAGLFLHCWPPPLFPEATGISMESFSGLFGAQINLPVGKLNLHDDISGEAT